MNTAVACLKRSYSDHPCFYGSAKSRWGRIHLPVAPHCNVQCRFCNRLYDCANESRPAVTRTILEPGRVLTYLKRIFQTRKDISVVGIAGPGDPLCDPARTLESLRAVHSAYPNLLICLSSNGLNMADHVDDLVKAGVTHATVTINAVDPEIGAKIYEWIKIDGRICRGREAAEILYARQREAVRRFHAWGVVVKINTVVIPGINNNHIESVAQAIAGMGADIMNCIPMIPVSETPFAHLESPTEQEMEKIRHVVSSYIPQMYHCRRCRADAAGLLHEEASSFMRCAPAE